MSDDARAELAAAIRRMQNDLAHIAALVPAFPAGAVPTTEIPAALDAHLGRAVAPADPIGMIVKLARTYADPTALRYVSPDTVAQLFERIAELAGTATSAR